MMEEKLINHAIGIPNEKREYPQMNDAINDIVQVPTYNKITYLGGFPYGDTINMEEIATYPQWSIYEMQREELTYFLTRKGGSYWAIELGPYDKKTSKYAW